MIYVNPDPWDTAPAVIVDSDASTNLQAVEEIAAWARDNNFVRVPNYHLNVVRRGNATLYRAFCYRLTEEEQLVNQERRARLDAAWARMPVTILEEV